MFGRKNNRQKKKKRGGRSLTSALMQVVIGGAIGGVVGVAVAPKRGKETREDIAKQTGQVASKVRDILSAAEKRHKKRGQ